MAKTEKTYVARDPRALAGTVVLWINLRLAASALNAVSDILQINGLSRMDPSTPNSWGESLPGMEVADLVTGLTSFLLLGAMLVSGFLTLKWFYRITMNTHVLTDGLRVSPPWSIGWFFVPFANLYKPFQALADAWAVAHWPNGWRVLNTPPLLRWWWGLWLVLQFIDNASFRLQVRITTVGMAQACAGLDLASDLLWIPLCVVLAVIVRRLSDKQADALSATAFD